MNKESAKKILVSSLIASVALGGGWLYASRSEAHAETQTNIAKLNETAAANGSVNPAGHIDKSGKTDHVKDLPITEEAASVLGMKEADLKKELKAGKSIVDVAKAKGVSEADLTAKLLDLRLKKIDEAVKAGRLDAVKADKIKQHMSKHLTKILNHKGMLERDGKANGKHEGVFSHEKLAQILGMTKAELETQLKVGKSLTEIAQSKGMTKQQLIDKIKEQMTPRIEKMVDHKKVDGKQPDQANQ